VNDDGAKRVASLFMGSEKCAVCKHNPVAVSVIRELMQPNSILPRDYTPTLAILPCEGKDAYEVRIRFFIDGMTAVTGDVHGAVWDGIRKAMKNYQGDGLVRARLARQQNPKSLPLPLPKFLGGKPGAP
jgi:hypothetical protein